jgi:AcrR family transcriptional regulator
MLSFDLSPFVRRPRQERSRAALSTIMTAAADVLARKGHDGFSMTEIAEAAGMAVANIYRRFESKDSIVQALALYNFQRLEEQIVAAMVGRRFASAGDVVAELAAIMTTVSDRNEALFRVLSTYPTPSAEYRDMLLAHRRRLVSYYKDAVSGFLKPLPEPQLDMVIGISYYIVASAVISKSRGDDPTMLMISWADLAQEVSRAATAYLQQSC